MFSHFDTIPACDGQTDGQMDRQTNGHMTMANTVLAEHRTIKIGKHKYTGWAKK